jgi:aldose 1-epimerase
VAMNEVVLENEHGRVVFSPLAGASLRSLSVVSNGKRHELLTAGDGPHDPTTLAQGTGCFIMAPWPSNMGKGVLYARGRTYQMPVNRPPHAIHGTVRDQEWSVAEANDTSARLLTELREPWPFPGTVQYDMKLDGPSLLLKLTVEAAPEEKEFPVGIGWHPWFRRDLGTGHLSVTARGQKSAWELDAEFNATGRQLEVPPSLSLDTPKVPGVDDFNTCFGYDVSHPFEVSWPDAVTLQMQSSEEMTQLVMYTTPESVCVEPISCTVDAFRLEAEGIKNTGTAYVAPGKPFSGWTRWSWM